MNNQLTIDEFIGKYHYNAFMMGEFWKFIANRQEIFYRRLRGFPYPWTDNPILRDHRFTNVFRASDRISQYLIKNVIYTGFQIEEEVIFRILLFKIFNLDTTWEFLLDNLGTPLFSEFDRDDYGWIKYAECLDNCKPLFNNAYMMGGFPVHGYQKKHWNLLKSLHDLLRSGHFVKFLLEKRGMKSVFEYLKLTPLFGKFVSYQYTLDLNYSDVIDYDENSFLFPGGGTIRGMRRIFQMSHTEAEKDGYEIVRFLVDNQESFQKTSGVVDCVTLFSRKLKVPDVANCLCEFDKYSRVSFPEIGSYGRKRIKQKYTKNDIKPSIYYVFPDKWNLRPDSYMMQMEVNEKNRKIELG